MGAFMAEKINITKHYDKDADILYIDFGSDEPCYTEDIDGFLMIDIGWFSKLPRGVKIISPKTHKVKSFKMVITQIEKTCRQLMKQQVKQIQTEEPMLQNILGQTLNRAFARVSS
jgi:hypothetical protein